MPKGQRINVEINYSGTIADRANSWGNYVRDSIEDQIRRATNTNQELVSKNHQHEPLKSTILPSINEFPVLGSPQKVTSTSFKLNPESPEFISNRMIDVPCMTDNEIEELERQCEYEYNREMYALQTEIEQLERDYADEYEAAFDCDEGWYVECVNCGNNILPDKFEDHCHCSQKIVWERKVVYC